VKNNYLLLLPKLYILCIIVSIHTACKQKQQANNRNYHHKPVTIIIQPFADIDSVYTLTVYKQLQKVYNHITINKPIPIFTKAYSTLRNRYRADSIIDYLQHAAKENEVILALTSFDISTTKNTHQDWGVMGLGFCPGKACIASTYRLAAKNKAEQFFKVAIHELGHTQGLPHCVQKTCYMRDAEGKNPTNEEVEFCKDCRKLLRTKGWNTGA
jgi:archaemetzincin